MYQSLPHMIIFTQMNAKNRINIFGDRVIAAIFKKYKQLYDVPMPGKPVVAPFNPDVLSPLDRKKTLEDVKLIKDKRCEKIKGLTCANDSKQIKYPKPDEKVYSPTCSTEALMETLIIYAMDQKKCGHILCARRFCTNRTTSRQVFIDGNQRRVCGRDV